MTSTTPIREDSKSTIQAGKAIAEAIGNILNDQNQADQPTASPPSGVPDASTVTPRPDVRGQSGGRGGQYVKGLSGPANSAIPSASGDRIFITDDQGGVVLDVDRNRGKVILPGKGFQKGGKITPTPPGYIDLIDKVFPR